MVILSFILYAKVVLLVMPPLKMNFIFKYCQRDLQLLDNFFNNCSLKIVNFSIFELAYQFDD